MMLLRDMRLSFLVALVVASAGCGQSKLAPVSGQVTMEGKPLAGVLVTFQPQGTGGRESGQGSTALTDESGHYTLRTVFDDQPGAVVGPHRVEIAAPVDTSSDKDTGGRRPKAKTFIPARYNTESELKMDVPQGGKQDANFELKSK